MDCKAKMMVESVTEHYSGGSTRRQTIKFQSHYDDSIAEDLRFQKANPKGSAEMTIDNQDVIDSFKPGEYCYVTFSKTL